LEDIFQAGAGHEILVDQARQVVYYSNYLDQNYWDFVVNNHLYDLDTLQAGPDTDFPVNAIELKASWRVAGLLDEPTETFIPDASERFHTMTANIPRVSVKGDTISENKDSLRLATMALVGLHVVGVVAHHPEFIWASFEHVDNAPDSLATPTGGTNSQTNEPWSFYAAQTPSGGCNQFDDATPMDPASICRNNPWGGGSPENQQNIQSLNASVHEALRQVRPLWANYKLVGGVWTTGEIPGPNGAPASIQRGSTDLANTSMETFQQGANCFACHNGGTKVVDVGVESAVIVAAKHINLSHFVVNYQAALLAKPR
jgi:hypothetical protein